MLVEEFVHGRHRLVYEVHGDGPKVLVFLHGLLLDAALNRSIAVALADRGHRVVLPELVGHGRSDRPTHAYDHRLELYADSVVALLDHLELDEAVIGGMSLGANVALQMAAASPSRVRALVLEMPVLERGGVAAMATYWPVLLALRYGGKLIRPITRLLGRLPRTGFDAADSYLNAASADPRVIAAIIHGVLVGPGTPPVGVRRALDLPTLVVGHGGDLMHPMDDADALTREMPAAHLVRAWSVVEARTFPARILREMDTFLREVWEPRLARPTAVPRTAPRTPADRDVR